MIKNKKGILATEEELRKMENRKKKLQGGRRSIKGSGSEKALESAKVVIAVKTGENGKLFGAITNKEVSTGIKETFHLDIDRKEN